MRNNLTSILPLVFQCGVANSAAPPACTDDTKRNYNGTGVQAPGFTWGGGPMRGVNIGGW